MAVITIPSGLWVDQFTWGQVNYGLTFASGDTGVQQTRVLAPPRWTATLAIGGKLRAAEAAKWKAFVLQLRGKINQAALYDLKQSTLVGTMAGSPVLTTAVAVGDTTFAITTTAGATVAQGDKIQLGTGATRQLFIATATATANGAGAMSLTVEPPSRYVQTLGSAVVYSQPTALFRLDNNANDWSATPNAEGNFSLSFTESWES